MPDARTSEPPAQPDGRRLVEHLQPNVSPGDQLGGKGRALGQLIQAGDPVPGTGVVTADAYRRMAHHPQVSGLVGRIIAGEAVDADQVDAVFAAVPVEDELESQISALAEAVGAGGPLAIRSSATVEDLATSSFAGQYRSVLEVPSDDRTAVMDAVRQVWASLWHPAPTAYRRAFGIDEDDVAMAVVLMAMIPATTAGVVFTADPGGSAGARVEAVEGLGESLVSGQRTPLAWVVPPAGAGAAPADLPVPVARALDLARAIEARIGTPQDIEWAAVDDEVFVVQARPITVLDEDDGFDTAIDDHELTTGGIVEMVPGVLSPLRWELNRFILEEAFRSVLDSLGIIRGLAAEARPFVRRVRGRAAIDFDQLRAAAAGIEGAVEELELQYFGPAGGGQAPDPTGVDAGDRAVAGQRRGLRARLAGLGSWFGALQRDVHTLQTRATVIDQAAVLIQVADSLAERPPALADRSDEQLMAYIRRLVDVAARGLTAELGVAAAAAASHQRLHLLLAKYLGPEEGARAALAVTSGQISAQRRPTSSAAVFGGRTWNERGVVPPTVHAASPDTVRDRRRQLEERLKALPGWTRRRVLTGQVIDVRIHLIRQTIADVVEQLHRRERAKAAVLDLGGEVRRTYLELGRRLRDRGALDDEIDIELLSTDEIVQLCGDGAPVGRDVLRRRRNWLSRYEAEGVLPTRFTGVPVREPAALPEGDEIEGWGASPGRYRGTARVLTGPDQRVERGDVVVAETTDAAWSPVFVQAGAIVVERGGPLSHAAILARELGLPCVMNAKGATAVLDDKTVVVDGDQGLVVIDDGEAR